MRTDHVIEVLEVRTVEPHEASVERPEVRPVPAGLPEPEPAPVLPTPA